MKSVTCSKSQNTLSTSSPEETRRRDVSQRGKKTKEKTRVGNRAQIFLFLIVINTFTCQYVSLHVCAHTHTHISGVKRNMFLLILSDNQKAHNSK